MVSHPLHIAEPGRVQYSRQEHRALPGLLVMGTERTLSVYLKVNQTHVNRSIFMYSVNTTVKKDQKGGKTVPP